MKKIRNELQKRLAAGAASVCIVCGVSVCTLPTVQAEEIVLETSGTELWNGEIVIETPETEERIGTYTVEEAWIKNTELSTEDETVYVKEEYAKEAETSTITCSYIDTNYSVLEYEQLRDMLTNNLFYSNVNAKVSTSAVYTLDKDYLYILIVDDSDHEYRDIYHYVVGDYRCFEVAVREYRSEADTDRAAGEDTPQEAGQKIAEEFVWDVQ